MAGGGGLVGAVDLSNLTTDVSTTGKGTFGELKVTGNSPTAGKALIAQDSEGNLNWGDVSAIGGNKLSILLMGG